ncbi:MAG: flagellar hook-basal body complex protein FliE [Lachnospiraceae bacterium]|nr:flagellar hook-basal body complex protein FliE [Lachnospiraceae bacterium]MBO4762199.1 flagellar hook-basal body complex protein FliE [Lachnospiraceae bacterium]MBQ6091842.1 flagellar hook-basal body complex protein FliE [Lachnospiraceae bacterium]MBR5369464.1 flagellar hook-basal body complex protein FliE [Lachnospiraceae bacterium]
MKLSGLNGLESISSAGSLKNPGKLTRLDGYQDSILSKEPSTDKTESFDSLLKSAMDMINETNEYSNQAGEAELAYAMGITNSTHDLQVAQMKANISLQYTVAVRNAVIEAYKEIMQMQF